MAAGRVREARLRALLEQAGVRIVATVADGEQALRAVTEQRPEVLLLDASPDSGGLDVVELLMARAPLPIVVVCATGCDIAGALACGAVDVVADTGPESDSDLAALLARQLRIASRVRVITHPRGRLRDAVRVPVLAGPDPVRREPPDAAGASGVPVVAIGASTGGPPALATVLAALPPDLPAAIVVVQHMAPGFLPSLASWLAGTTDLTVCVARDGQRVRAGEVLLAPSQANLELSRGPRVRLTAPRAGQLHVPEVDTTFASVARCCGAGAVGVLLTGMGRDGAAGLLTMRLHGAHTIGQDERTSAVWGMPGAARALDAVEEVCPLPEIAARITDAVGRLVGAPAGGRR